jgi:hypothetical protein
LALMPARRQILRISGGSPFRASDSVIDGARLPQPLRQILVRVPASLRQRLQRLALFERRQVLALDVLDERDLEHLRLVDVPDDGRQLDEAGLHRGLIAPLAGDDLEARASLPDDQRLDDPLLLDRRDELGQVAHGLARLVGIGVETVDRNHPSDRRPGRRGERFHVVRVVAHAQRVG